MHLTRTGDGRRRVTEISELTGYQDGEYVLSRLFETDDEMRLIKTGAMIMNRRKLELNAMKR